MMRSAETNGWERLVLVGFMGAGKSTVGTLLASRLKLPFLDSDATIEKQTAKSIARLFEERGEAEFRSIEEHTVADLLSRTQVVIALGGGALESLATRKLLAESKSSCVIHLEAPLKTMLERCQKSAPVRPLLQDQVYLTQRHARRLEHYRDATLTVMTEGLAPTAVVEVVLKTLFPDQVQKTGLSPNPDSLHEPSPDSLHESMAQKPSANEASGQ